MIVNELTTRERVVYRAVLDGEHDDEVATDRVYHALLLGFHGADYIIDVCGREYVNGMTPAQYAECTVTVRGFARRGRGMLRWTSAGVLAEWERLLAEVRYADAEVNAAQELAALS